MKWPKLPKVVHAPGGSITVVQVDQPKDDDGEEAFGLWDPAARVISIQRGHTPRFMWATFYHEMMHACLSDSGLVNLLTNDSAEALCEAVATARLVEMVGQQLR